MEKNYSMKENNKNEVRVINIVQAKAYIKNGLQPIRIEADDVLVFIFDRELSRPLYNKWTDRTLVF